jgi:acyl carrier protein
VEAGLNARSTSSSPIEASLIQFISSKLVLDSDETISETTPLFNGLLDSLGALQLAAFVEETFGIRVDDGELSPENFETIELLAAYIRRKSGRA